MSMGAPRHFAANGFSGCGPAIHQTSSFSGAAAASANDGTLDITFKENGDYVGLDYSKLTVTGTCGPSTVTVVDSGW